MSEPDILKGLPEGIQALLAVSERVFLISFDRQGVIRQCSDSLRRLLGDPVPPTGRAVGDLFLPAVQGAGRVSLADLAPGEDATPFLARLAMNGRPCRLVAISEGEGVTCWGEVIGDRATTGLNEMSGLAGQMQGLLAQVRRQHEQLQQDLNAAAWLQSRFLPKSGQLTELQAAWKFRPCGKIGGDFFNFFPLPGGTVAAYILDVAGHGVPAAMMGVAVVQALQQLVGLQESGSHERQSMRALMMRLEEEFPMDRFNLYFTLVYLEIDRTRKHISWVNAGHPPPILHSRGNAPVLLTGGGSIIGLGSTELIPEQHLDLNPGDRIYLYSDGVTERRSSTGELFDDGRLISILGEEPGRSLRETVDQAIAANDAFGAPNPANDDLTLLGIELVPPEPGPAGDAKERG